MAAGGRRLLPPRPAQRAEQGFPFNHAWNLYIEPHCEQILRIMEIFTLQTLGFLQNMNPIELAVVLFLILLLFGAKRLPELGRGMGQFIREFKKTRNEIEENIRASLEEEPSRPRRQASPVKPRPSAVSTEAASANSEASDEPGDFEEQRADPVASAEVSLQESHHAAEGDEEAGTVPS